MAETGICLSMNQCSGTDPGSLPPLRMLRLDASCHIADGARGSNPFANAFGPDVLSRLAAEPKFARYLEDPMFVSKLAALQQNPNNMQAHLSDPRIMEVSDCARGYILDCILIPR